MATIVRTYALILPEVVRITLGEYPRQSIDDRRKAIWDALRQMNGPMPDRPLISRRATLSEILREERLRSYDNGSVAGGLQSLAKHFTKYQAGSAANLLRLYPVLDVADRKALCALAIKQLTEKPLASTEMRWLYQFRERMGIQHPIELFLSTPGEISAEDWKKM